MVYSLTHQRRAGQAPKLFVLLLAACALVFGSRAAMGQNFVLHEQLGRRWTNELVTFPLTPRQLADVNDGAGLIGPGDEPLPVQLAGTQGAPRLAFQVTLEPGATRSYRLGDASSPPTSDIRIEQDAQTLRMSNAHVAIALRKSLIANEAPIAGIRLRSGVWTDGATLVGGNAIKDYRVELLASGPVFAEAVCRITFSDRGTWSLRIRLLGGEPVILINENYDAPAGGSMRLPLGGGGFRPTRMLYRQGMGELGKLQTWAITAGEEATIESWLRDWLNYREVDWRAVLTPGKAFMLEPWLRWWMNERQGNWFAVYTPADESPRDETNDLLMVAALRPSRWIDPDWQGKAKQLEPLVPANVDKGVVVLQLPLSGGGRSWLLGTPPRDASIAPLSSGSRNVAPLPQQYQIKYGDFPLDEVKDYVLDWQGDHDDYPRLFVRQKDLPAIRSRLNADHNEIAPWAASRPIDKYNLEGPLQAWLMSGDPALSRTIAETSQAWLEQVVNEDLLEQNGRVTLGVAPHNQAVLLLPTINLTDAALGCGCITDETRKNILARIAFLGYALDRDDYWSPERGFEANPNMTTVVALYRTAVAALIPSHPMARKWADHGLDELKRELYEWSDQDGGWLEAPHYAMVSFDHMIGAFLMASNAGFADLVHDWRLRKIIEWLAKISTPRDWRTGGYRHYPPIGNTYMGESTGMFGIVAGIWQDKDPVFAANMEWMYQEHGRAPIGLLGAFGTFSGYRSLLQASGVSPKAPSYGSEWFRDTGVVLRNAFGSGRETYLHLIAGSQHEHYDFDSGSIVLWGKGSLLADDFGYIGRHPATWHSMLTSAAVADDAVMLIETFAPGQAFDYVLGRKGTWQRQIAFLKDANPLGPTGFLIRDTHDADALATWKLWLTTAGISVNGSGATITGEDDVDLDIFFFEPEKLNLETEMTVQQGQGLRDGKTGKIEIEQTALVASLNRRGALSALLLPRLKTDPVPKITWFSGGNGVRVETAAGTDYLFMASPLRKSGRLLVPNAPFTSTEGGPAFQCTACAVQVRSRNITMTLATPGKIRFGNHILESDESTQRTYPR